MRLKRTYLSKIYNQSNVLIYCTIFLFLQIDCAFPVSNAPVTYYVAQNGDDDNPGTYEQPYFSIERAQDEIRKLKAEGLQNDITVKVRGGVYYLPNGLMFGAEDSGTEKYRITYSAFDDEIPVLIGGLVVSDWTLYSGKIMASKIPDGVKPNQLFENGRRLTMARTPNTGYYKVQRPLDGKKQKAFFYDSKELSAKYWNYDDANVLIWPGHDWRTWEKKIDRIDFDKNVIEFGDYDGWVGYPMTSGNRYFIKNAFEFLDKSGEYQISYKKNMIYLWPTEKLSDGRYIVSTADTLIDIKGSDENPVQNLHFSGLNLSISNYDAVRFSGAKNCSIKLCLIENSGDNGVEILDYTNNINIKGNLIRKNGGHGVNIKGFMPGKPDVTFGHTIENNHIHHCGRLKGHGAGVRASQSGENKILNNYIHDMPRHGIVISGRKWTWIHRKFKETTYGKHYKYLYSRNNVVAYNTINHVNLDSQDTGAIYLCGTGLNNSIHNNLIHDSGCNHFDLQSGIYIDSTSDYSYLSNNIIYNIIGKGRNNPVIFAKGIGTKIINNILVVGPSNSSAIKSTSRPMHPSGQHVYKRNIMYFENVHSAIYEIPNWTAERVVTCDYNIYYNPLGTPVGLPVGLLVRLPGRLLGKLPHGNFFKSLRMTISKFNMDSHSIFTDPDFVDIEKRNFNLRGDSPAIALGFVPIDIKKIGTQTNYINQFKE
jgi:hypothetical protein